MAAPSPACEYVSIICIDVKHTKPVITRRLGVKCNSIQAKVLLTHFNDKRIQAEMPHIICDTHSTEVQSHARF
jgi:hypothetical protein